MNVILALADASWRIGLLAGVVLMLRPWVRRFISARTLFTIWTVLALLLLVPVAIPSVFSPYNLIPRAQARVADPVGGPSEVAPSVSEATLPPAASAPAAALASPAGPGTAGGAEGSFRVSPAFAAIGLWAAGTFTLLGWHAMATAAFRRRVRADRHPIDERAAAILIGVARSLGLARIPRVAVTGAVMSPAVHGLLRPELLFPAGFCGRLSDGQLRFVMLHELGHLRHADLWSLFVLRLAAFCHWFNPAAWLAVRAAERDCEHACDEFVAGQVADRAAYAETLVSILRLLGSPRIPMNGLGVISDSGRLARRIEQIMSSRRNTRLRTAGGLVVLACVTAVGLSCRKSMALTPGPLLPGWVAVNAELAEKKDYAVGMAEGTAHQGSPAMFMKSMDPTAHRSAHILIRTSDATVYRGKRVRFAVWLKSSEVTQVNLHISAVGHAKPRILAMETESGPRGNLNWKQYAVAIDVPAESVELEQRVSMLGKGTVFAAEPTLEVANAVVATPPVVQTVAAAPWKTLARNDWWGLPFDQVPSDRDVQAPLAVDEEPDKDVSVELELVRKNIPLWAYAKVADPVQRVRNLLAIAAVVDSAQWTSERFIPWVVWERLSADYAKDDLLKVLTWIALHPTEGSADAADKLAGVGVQLRSPGEYEVRRRTQWYAIKFVAEALGKPRH